MRPRWLCAAGCGLALAPVGCFLFPKPPTGVGKLTPFPPDLRADLLEEGVAFDTRLVEQPADDAYLARGVWGELTDPLPHQQSALLAANGLRVGVASGPLSGTFESLATGQGTAVAPTLRRGLLLQPKTIPVNGPLDRLTAEVVEALTDDPRALDVTAAECAVSVTATREPGGRVTVRCQWLVQHGQKRPKWTPTGDGGFDRADGRDREDLNPLAFEVELSPKDTLVVGATKSPDGTLGGGFFVTPDGAKRRVLVVKASAER
jgi:hypothetical protein